MRNTIFIMLTAAAIFACSVCTAHGTAKPETTRDTIRTIDDVVVTGTRSSTDIRHLPMSISVVNRDMIESSLQPSLLPVLTRQVPGLFNTSRGIMGYGVSTGAAGGLSLRGISSGNGSLMVLIDGHPQYMGLMGHPIADAYQSFLAEKVEVLRGPASALYGSNAMGGVINIVTRQMREEGVRTAVNAGYGSYNTLQTEATNRIRKGRFSSIISGSYNRTDGHRPDMGFEQYGGYAKLGYEISAAWNIRADVNVTHFNASNPGEVSAPLHDADQRITRGMTSLAVQNDYGKTSGSVSFFYNWGRHWINDGYGQGESPKDYRFNSRDRMTGISLYQSATLFKGNRITIGADYFNFGGKSWNFFPEEATKTMLVDKTQHEIAGYADFRQHLGSWLTLDAGIRLDHHSHAGTQWIPQAGISFNLPSNIDIKVMASKGFRFPTIREMYMFRPANPDLRPESMWNYEISFAQRLLEGKLSYGINIFYIDGKNTIQTLYVEGRMMNVNTGKIDNAGVEIQMLYRISPAWSADVSYSFLHMKYPVVAAPEHKLCAGASFTKRRWMVSTDIQYIDGLYTAVGTSDGKDNRTENFVLWSLRGRFAATKWLALWVRGENLLAQKYEINAGFPMPKATVMGGMEINF